MKDFISQILDLVLGPVTPEDTCCDIFEMERHNIQPS